MLGALIRKARQVAGDPVLRRWLALRTLRLTAGEPAFTAHRPPYLGDATLPLERPRNKFSVLAGQPGRPIRLRLPGHTIDLAPGKENSLFSAHIADTETRLGLHRFAWAPLMGAGDDPAWVAALWRGWAERFGTPSQDWSWHPYTAAERAINLLCFARRHGLPKGAAELLAAHAPVIAAGLEWFGDHHTSNHCANNGRGLYLLGLALGLEQATEMGARILVEEGRRIFRPSGLLREGSSHYHLLLTRSWASVWLAARAHARPEAAELEAVLRRALAVLPNFQLPGRFPLVGDISPDCPPEHLFGLLPGAGAEEGWTGLLELGERTALAALHGAAAPAEGWLKFAAGPWTGLWHAEPEGWSTMPGHGHQDLGGFELHYEDVPVFVDVGRGSYAVSGEADPEVAGGAHNTLLVDGADPYPANKPYFSDVFRRSMITNPPVLAAAEGVRLSHWGFSRLGGVGEVARHWRFEGRRLTLADSVQGSGAHTITRRLHTPLAAEKTAEGVRLRGETRSFLVRCPQAILEKVTIWHAYGEGRPGTRMELTDAARLPWRGELVVEAL